MNFEKIIWTIYNNSFFNSIIKTLVSTLENELKDCRTILDVGCGPKSPSTLICKKYGISSTGIELHKPYLETAKKNKTHDHFFQGTLQEFVKNNPNLKFDAVIMIDVVEHLTKDEGTKLIHLVESLSLKKTIINSPNGFVEQKALDNNPYQEHLSGWDLKDMNKLGYKSRGLAGLKFLRTEVESETMGNDLTASIKYKPKKLFFCISVLSQIFCFYFPKFAFSLFSVKEK